MENSLKFLSEDFEAYLLLTHKELVSIENVHCDLIRIISMNLPIMMNTLRRSSTHLTDELIETLDMSLSGYKAMIQNHSKLFPILVELIKYLKRATNTDDEASEKEQKEKGKKEGGLERKNSGMMSITLMTSQIKKEVDSINIRKNQFLTIFREYNSFARSSKNDEDLKSSLVSTDFEIMGRFFFRSELFGKRRKEELASMFMTLRSEANEERFRQFLELLITQSSPSKNNVTDNFILKSLKLIEIYSNSAEFTEEDNLYKECRKDLIKESLLSIGFIELACELMAWTESKRILTSILRIMNAILEGGNKKAQSEFLKYCEKHNSVKILGRFSTLLNDNFEKISKKILERNTQEIRQILYGEIAMHESEDSELDRGIETCMLLFRFLQLLCEGLNSNAQNYLRNQNHNRENHDLISEAVLMFGAFIKFFNKKSYLLGSGIISFLIESLQGPCKENQNIAIKCKILDFAQDFLNELSASEEEMKTRGFNMTCQDDKLIIGELFVNTISLYLALLESNTSHGVADFISRTVPFQALIRTLVIAFSALCERLSLPLKHTIIKDIKERNFDKTTVGAFKIVFFIRSIERVSRAYKKAYSNLEGLEKEAFLFFYENSDSIEIVIEGNVEQHYFVKFPVCNYLDEEYKDILINTVNRETPTEKITDFLSRVDDLIITMEFTFEATKKNILNPIFITYIRILCLVMSLIINTYMLVFLRTEVINYKQKVFTDEVWDRLFNPLVITHMALSIVLIVLHLAIRTPLLLVKKWKAYLDLFKKSAKNRLGKSYEDKVLLQLLEKNVLDINAENKMNILRRKSLFEGNLYPTPRLTFYYLTLKFLLLDATLVYFIFYFLCIFVGWYNQLYVMYWFSLMDMVFQNEKLINVVRSITFAQHKIMYLGLMSFLLVYIFASFGHHYLMDSTWNPNFGAAGELQCSTIIQCWLTIFSLVLSLLLVSKINW
jgi:hypothetical protein